jgi:hypothetical protein
MSKERKTIVTFFPVGNGDMTLLALADNAETKILIDCNIRDRLKRDSKGRPYVDVFLLSHGDWDHCRGIVKHFYLGPPNEYPDDKKKDSEKRILIREIWSSPLVFRRAGKLNKLCDEVLAFTGEAKRRVKVNREKKFLGVAEGDRVLVLGEDEDGKTDDLRPILIKIDEVISKINGSQNYFVQARLLAPLPKSDKDEEEEVLSRNHSSVVLNIELRESVLGTTPKYFLTGGDAEVAIWERLWEKHKKSPSLLVYDLMQTPHHCSWHTLSYDSWSEKHEEAEVSKSARAALSQIRNKAKIVASSCPVEDDDCDPPCHGAKLEYEKIAASAAGEFFCTTEYPTRDSPAALEFYVSKDGFEELGAATPAGAPAILTSGIVDAFGARVAERAAVKKEGNRRYA